MSTSSSRARVAPLAHRDGLPSTSRYDLFLKIASGGMATVYVGGLSGAAGFRRIVAIKRAHPHLLEDPIFKAMLVAEAKMAALVRHPNVIGVHDVEELEGELLLVMEYIEGASLAQVIMAGTNRSAIDASIALRIIRDACEGLHAIHQLCDDDGQPLGLVHRDISPQNILVGIDGMARVADFGIAKASAPEWAAQHTATGALRGKTGYMAPEYVETCVCEPQSDVFSLGVVAWEALTRRRLFKGSSDIETIKLIRSLVVSPPSSLVASLPDGLDAVILKALARDPADRWPTARAFGEALEDVLSKTHSLAAHGAVEERMKALFGESMTARRAAIRLLQAVPPSRPVSEVLLAAAPIGTTPATNVPSSKSPIVMTLGSAKLAPSPALVHEESSGSAASFEIPATKPKRLLAMSSAVLGVLVIALAMVAVGLAQRPTSVAAASGGEPTAPIILASTHSTRVAAATSVVPAFDVEVLPASAQPAKASPQSTKIASRPAPTSRAASVASSQVGGVSSAHQDTVSAAPNVAPQTKPAETKPAEAKPDSPSAPAVPKNPYAP